MNYPVWDPPLGYGPLMALIAVVHVFVSHFAIGGGLYLVVSEHRARRRGDAAWLDHLRGLTRFFVLVTLVFGALTGVGIWFVIGLLSPVATEALIHHFVWGWAIEWTFFVVEILAAILYFHGWGRMTARAHLTLGWIYFVAAWLSLAVINGILAFMLTPGRWLESGSFWDGFFNPTYASTLVLRTGICLMLAGLYTLLVAGRLPAGDLKGRLVRWESGWALAGLAIVAPSYLWYLRAIPDSIVETARASMPWVMLWHERVLWLAAILAVAVVVLALVPGRRMHVASAAMLMALGFAWFGSFEFLRESIRKPWIVAGTIYGNGVEVARLEETRSDGLLAHAAYRSGDDGHDLFLRACRSCHTLDGYKALAPAFDGTDAAFAAGAIRGVARMRGNMPPFPGSHAESEILGAWIAERVDTRPLAEIHGLAGEALGARAFAVRCARCHVPGGALDMLPTLEGLGADEMAELLDAAGELSDEMPPFTGDDRERAALADHLVRLASGDAR